MTHDLESLRLRDLARELATLTGDTTSGAVEVALREAIARRRRPVAEKRTVLGRIVRDDAQRPVRDDRTPEEIIGYDDQGRPS
jgi:antitoxin VapB